MPLTCGRNPAGSTISFSVATYNVHCWVGCDGHYDPARVIRVLQELNAGILCLQEVTVPADENIETEVGAFASMSGMKAIRGPTFFKRDGCFGNLLLTAHPCLSVRRIDLSVTNREPRGAIDVNLDIKGSRIRLIATHLGLRAFERRLQVKKLLREISGDDSSVTILTGDFNEWFPASKVLRRLRARFGDSPAPGTFPAVFPLLALDRIWARPAKAMTDIQVHNSPLARIASDHLPLKASFVLY